MSTKKSTAIKICGITTSSQAKSIAKLGVNAIGVIGVKNSKRFVSEAKTSEIFKEIESVSSKIERVLVTVNITDAEINQSINLNTPPSVIQLHGNESPARCQSIKKNFPSIKLWKALRVRDERSFKEIALYEEQVDALLLDAWHGVQLGGTGKRIPLKLLKGFKTKLPWWLAGGICAEYIPEVLSIVTPDGIDASSQLEISPRLKDINKICSLLAAVKKHKRE